jgi:hypothetical protein
VIGKANSHIQLLAGVPNANSVKKNDAIANRATCETTRAAALAANDADLPAAMLAYLSALKDYHKVAPRINADPGFSKGILLRTQEASMPIYLHTAMPDSFIELIQGNSEAPGPASSRKISLTSSSTTIQDNDNVKLALDGPGSQAVFQVSATTSVKLGANAINVAASEGVGLDLSAASANLKASQAIHLTVGPTSVTIEDSSVKASCGGTSFNLMAACLKLG